MSCSLKTRLLGGPFFYSTNNAQAVMACALFLL